MPDDKNGSQELVYAYDKPRVLALRRAFDDTLSDLSGFRNQAQASYRSRHNQWPGKSNDMRKHGADAFPWDGAADTEPHVTNERIDAFVALFMTSLQRANIRAYPVNGGDIEQAKVVSGFLKWMIKSYIPRFQKEMELAGNYMLERAIAITYVGWHREERTFLQKFSLESIAQSSPELAELIMDKANDPTVIGALQQLFPKTKEKRLKKALNSLRKTGFAELSVSRPQVNAPMVETLPPDGDFFFPAWVTDPQRAPYCFWRTFLTAQELRNKVETDGWDKEWVDEVIEMASSTSSEDSLERSAEDQSAVGLIESDIANDIKVEVIEAYQRLIDKEDNSEGIYRTVFSHSLTGDDRDPMYAKFELMSGYEDYPVVITRLSEASNRFYDVTSMAERLRGIQEIVKVERDSRVDRNSMATLPPIMHPVGNPPSEWGPGRRVPYRRGGEFHFGPVPQYNAGSHEIEKTMLELADRGVGLNAEDPLSASKRQFYVDKFLSHVQGVINLAFKCFQRFGPDEVFFQVTGQPEQQRFVKGNADSDYDITIQFDVLNNDPETAEKRIQMFTSLLQFDKNGRIDVDEWLGMVAGSIDPVVADRILRPAETAQAEVMKQVTDNLSKIYAGIEQSPPANGQTIAMQAVQQYVQQPDIMEKMQTDEQFKERITKYAEQIQFALQQSQNAEIGRIGTVPAAMGSMNTQGIQ
jgi:hypothetical protein